MRLCKGDLIQISLPAFVGNPSSSLEIVGIYLQMRRTSWTNKYIFARIITVGGVLEYPVLISNSDMTISVLQKISDVKQDDLQS